MILSRNFNGDAEKEVIKSPCGWEPNLNNRLSRGDFAIFQSHNLPFFRLFKKNIFKLFVSKTRMFLSNNKMVLPDYVFGFTKSAYYEEFVKKTQRAVGQPNINAQEYGDLKICVLPIEHQTRFLNFLKQSDKSKFETRRGGGNCGKIVGRVLQNTKKTAPPLRRGGVFIVLIVNHLILKEFRRCK